MSEDTQEVLYRSNISRYRGWAGVFGGEFETCPKCNGLGWTVWAEGVNGNCTECHGFGVREVEHSPAVVEVHGDVPLVDDAQFVLALTPGLAEETNWEDREQLAAAVADAAATGLADSWWAFAEQPLKVDNNGDIWA